MSKYTYKITKDNEFDKGLCISVCSPENKELKILNTLIMIDVNVSARKTLTLLNSIKAVLNGEQETYNWLGEICAIYVGKEKSMIVDTLSGYNYNDDYEGYDYPDVIPPDICDYEEIETVALKEILEAWYEEITLIHRKKIINMSKYITKDSKLTKRLRISVCSSENKQSKILNTLIIIDLENKRNTLNLLNNIEAVLNGEQETYNWLGEICVIYVGKEKSMIVDTLSGFNYDEKYESYDYPDVTPPDICDYEEIETIELKNILATWYDTITNN
ncbi:MAG: hypothetical protein K2J88_00895 [Oscillospiraceae bacterium]|nr:hypothetical protein [Oscillospiraceae bacterium]